MTTKIDYLEVKIEDMIREYQKVFSAPKGTNITKVDWFFDKKLGTVIYKIFTATEETKQNEAITTAEEVKAPNSGG